MKNFKKAFYVFLSLAILVSMFFINGFSSVSAGNVWDGSVAAGFSVGVGTEESPYIITTAEELAYLSQQVSYGYSYSDCYFELGADIILNDTTNWQEWGKYNDENQLIAPVNTWTPIGLYSTRPFEGNFDGKDYTVKGMYVNGVTGKFFGLFGYAASYDYYGYGTQRTVKNLNITESYVFGENTADYFIARVGGIVGYGNAVNCSFSGKVKGGSENSDAYVGGITGYGNAQNCQSFGSVDGYDAGGITGDGDAENCTNNAQVTGDYAAGITYSGDALYCVNNGKLYGKYGVGGICQNGSAAYCINNGDMESFSGAGGIVCDNWVNEADEIIKYCYNSGNITVKDGYYDEVGGIAANGVAQYCYNTGDITVVDSEELTIGGIVGVTSGNSSFPIVNCYSVGNVSGNGVVGKNENENDVTDCYYLDSSASYDSYAVALSQEQMKKASSFSGFNFNKDWEYLEGAEYPYPTLRCFGSKVYGYGVQIYDGDRLISSATIPENSEYTFKKLGDKGDLKFYAFEYDGKYYFDGDSITVTKDYKFNAVWKSENKGVNTWDGSFDTEWEGQGTEESPYIISTAEELAGLARKVNEGNAYYGIHFLLNNDIYLNDTTYDYSYYHLAENQWEPIGHNCYVTDSQTGEFICQPWFDGNFDGNGHTVHGIYIKTENQYVGLFGYASGEIKNLKIANSYICGLTSEVNDAPYIGGIAGYARGIYECKSSVVVESVICDYCEDYDDIHPYVGGIVGNANTVSGCENNGTVRLSGRMGNLGNMSIDAYIGGVVGRSQNIENCVNNGTVCVENCVSNYSNNIYMAGVAGASYDYAKDCVNNGSVTSARCNLDKNRIDGVELAGVVGDSNLVENCKNFGYLSSCGNISGVVSSAQKVNNCYNEADISGYSVCGIVRSAQNISLCNNKGNITVSFLDGDSNLYAVGVAGSVKVAEDLSNSGDITLNMQNIDTLNHYIKAAGVLGHLQAAYYKEEQNNYRAIRCVNSGDITVNNSKDTYNNSDISIGGTVATADYYSIVTQCINKGNIYVAGARYSSGSDDLYVGGVLGYGQLTDCYNTGNITVGSIRVNSDNYALKIGGLLGEGGAYNSYSIGNITVESNTEENEIATVGGIAGAIGGVDSVEGCYYLESCNKGVAVLNTLGEAKTNLELKDKAAFKDWDFNKYWEMGGVVGYAYPNLRFEGSGTHRYLVTFIDSDNTVSEELLYGGSEIVFTAPSSKFGYEFAYWQSGFEHFEKDTRLVLEKDMTFTAVWIKKNSESVWDGSFDTDWAGDGTESNPYLIGTAEELFGLAKYHKDGLSSEGLYFKQTKDIYINTPHSFSDTVMGENKWIPIGSDGNRESAFKGTFDGGGFSVYGIYYKGFEKENNSSYAYFGLFGNCVNATIKNVTVKSSFISFAGNSVNNVYLGGIVGMGENVTFENCRNEAAIVVDDVQRGSAGGIIGYVKTGFTAASCSNNGHVKAHNAGGIVGEVDAYSYNNSFASVIDDCHNSAKVESSSYSVGNAGGIVGELYDNSVNAQINNCINTGVISVNNGYGAGIAGYLDRAIVSDCENTGKIYGNGGIVGEFYRNASVYGCVNKGDIECSDEAGGIVGNVSNNYYSSITSCTNYGNIQSSKGGGGIFGSGYTNIQECFNYGNVTSVDGPLGGIAGSCNYSIYKCENYGKVTLTGVERTTSYNQNTGGIAGVCSNVTYCTNYGDVTSYAKYYCCTGGIVGEIEDSPYFENNVNSGNVTGVRYVGGIAGDTGNSYSVALSTNTGNVTGETVVGGVVGNGNAETSSNAGRVTALGSYVGGVTGDGDAELCYNTGKVSGDTYIGGVTGYGDATDCYNKADVSGLYSVGGVSGYGDATRCYNVGNVTSSKGVAASICGYKYSSITDCYYLDSISVTGAYDYETILNGTAVSSTELSAGNLLGFDFETVWTVGEAEDYDYPTLRSTVHYVTYTVKFLDADGVTILKEQKVNKGFSAYPPIVDSYEDADYVYAIDHWDGDYKNITSNTTVKAVYKKTEKIKFRGIHHSISVPFGFSADNLLVTVESVYSRLLCKTTHDYQMMCRVEWDLEGYNPNASGNYTLTGVISITDSPYYEMATGESVTITVTVQEGEADVFDQSHLTYDLNGDNTVTITGYTGNAAEIRIPSSLDGYTVSAIADNAFKGNTSVITLYVPSTVKSIGANAFSGCTSLVQVTFNEGLEFVGEYAFADTALTNITLPASLSEIGKFAFACYGEDSFVDGFVIYAFDGTAGVDYAEQNGIACVKVLEKTDSDTGIKVIAEQNVNLAVALVTSGDYFEAAGEIKENSEVTLFEIKLFNNTADELQPGNMMTVNIPLPLGYDENSKIYRINADGSYMDMNAVYKDGMLQFSTAHLSYYAIISDSNSNDDVILGDVNGNGVVDTTDLANLKLHLAGIEAEITSGADINKDGDFTTVDLAKLKLMLVGL